MDEKLIDSLKNLCDKCRCFINQIPSNGNRPFKECPYRGISSDHCDEYNVIEQSIKPSSVIYEGDGYSDGEMVYDIAVCPNCDRHFERYEEEHYKHCPSCGQPLDWGEKNKKGKR